MKVFNNISIQFQKLGLGTVIIFLFGAMVCITAFLFIVLFCVLLTFILLLVGLFILCSLWYFYLNLMSAVV